VLLSVVQRKQERFNSITCTGANVQPDVAKSPWAKVSAGKLEWLDIKDPTREDTSALAQKYPFHPLNLEDCLSKRQLTRVEDHESHVFVLMYFPTVGADGLVTRNQLSMFVGEDYLVTLHGSTLPAVSKLVEELKLSDDLRTFSMKNSANLVYTIIDRLVEGVFPLLDKLRDDLDEIEDQVYDERVSPAARINSLRREVADLRRIMIPLRRTLSDAWTFLQRYATKDLAAYFRDVLDHVDKVAEALVESSETIEIYKDTNFLLSTNKTNQVLTILTIIFTLTLPAAVVAAIYGMNVPLPIGNGENPPTFLGPYTSFIILITIMVVPAVLLAWYFRRAGWL
jgi:magnesium transporter